MKEKTYSKEIYKYAVLEKAISDYKHLAGIELTELGREWKCSFSSDIVPLDILMLEFDNYLIELAQLHL